MSTRASFADNLVNPGFETGDLTGWTQGTVVDFAGVVGPDGYNTPYQGNYMLRLGTPGFNARSLGPNTVYQDFVVVNPTLTFAYDVFTYDYTGYDKFYYRVEDVSTGTNVAYYSQTAWGSDLSLKTTGWRTVSIDLSAYMGKTLRLEFDAEETGDTYYTTWAYVDSAAPTDTVPPVTTATLSGTLGNNGWYTSDVSVTLQATDNEPGGSGVKNTEYSFDGSTWTTYVSPFTITTEGTTTLYFRSTDNAGNIEATKTQTIKIDKTPPVITITSPQPTSYYHAGLLTLDFSATDTVSAVATTTALLDGVPVDSGQTIDLKTLGLGQHTLAVDATDNAGNNASSTAQFNVIPVPFATFSAKIQAEIGRKISETQLEIQGAFTLGQQSDGIDPVNETVTLSSPALSLTIPPGSFKLASGNKDENTGGTTYTFEGMVNGNKTEIQIISLGNNNYKFHFEIHGLNPCRLKNPSQVTLTIGDDSGTAQVPVKIAGLKNWNKVCPGIPAPVVSHTSDD